MKDIFRSRMYNRRRKWISCLAILILLISMFPATVLGVSPFSITTTPSTVTESDVESIGGFTATFTLPTGIKWGTSIDSVTSGTINSLLIPNLKNAFQSSSDQDLWNKLINNAPNSNFTVSSDHTSISIAFPAYTNYDIQQDQTITFTPPASLLEDSASSNIPASSTLTITATPKAILAGSLIEGATEADIVSGGRTLSIKLVNCQWPSDIATNATKRITLFNELTATGNQPEQWNTNVRNALISAPNPSSVINRLDDHTVIITLPATPSYSYTGPQTVTLSGLDKSLILDMSGTPYASDLTFIDKNIFTINGNTVEMVSTPTSLQENSMSGAILTLILSGNSWASDLPSDYGKKSALLNGFTAASDQAAWNNIKTEILASGTFSLATDKSTDDTLNIKLPSGIDTTVYNISADQTVTVQVPSTVLTNNIPLSNQLSFTITANPAVAVSGTLTQKCNELDIVNGGKTIIATLTNATWDSDVTISKTKREKLIDDLLNTSLTWPANALDTIKAGATYSLDNPQQVTITLPPVPDFNLSSELTISPSIPSSDVAISTSSTSLILTSGVLESIPSSSYFSISPVSNQTATITGTINSASESDMVTGGKTLVITLSNDVWAPDIVSNSNKLKALIENGLTSTTTATDPANILSYLRQAIENNPSSVVRTGDKILTITLPPIANYHLDQDQTINVNIPNGTTVSGVPYYFTTSIATPINAGSITIKAVTVTLSGTAVTAPLDSKAVTTGGKTIILTLKNATWASDVTTEAKVAKLLDSFTSTGSNWSTIKAAIKPQNITRSNSALTIKLPPISTTLTNSETVTFEINGSGDPLPFPMLINEALSSSKNLTDTVNKLQIGQVISSYSVNLTTSITSATDIVSGGQTIKIILLGGIQWDPSLPTTSAKKSSLVKSFTADTSSASWALVQAALTSNSSSKYVISQTSYSNDTLTITLPPVSSYNIIKNQTISLAKIPKTVLYQATADVPVSAQIVINMPSTTDRGYLDSLMKDGSLVNYINQIPLTDIYLDVPTKYITSIVYQQATVSNTGTTSSGGSSSVTDTINSFDIYTDPHVDSVKVVINSTPYTSSTPIDSTTGRKFNIAFATDNSSSATTSTTSSTSSSTSFDMTITAMEGGNVVQTCYEKISSPKTYSLAPSTDLSGYYSLYSLVNNSSLLSNILKYYLPSDLKVRTH